MGCCFFSCPFLSSKFYRGKKKNSRGCVGSGIYIWMTNTKISKVLGAEFGKLLNQYAAICCCGQWSP